MADPVKVLVIDDSALVREVLAAGLDADPDIEVVGRAMDVYAARDKIVYRKPDVLTLDVEMPRMDGVTFLRRLMPQYPLPVVMVSSMTEKGSKITLDALEAGAVDFVLKPSMSIRYGLQDMIPDLIRKVKEAAKANVSGWKQEKVEAVEVTPQILEGSTDKVIAIGASTGGTTAITRVIQSFSATMPGTVIVQHMPPVFTKMFADTLNSTCKVEVSEARDGDRIITGRVLIAPGGMHMEVVRSGGQYVVRCCEGEPVNGHCPSVDVLLYSVAANVGVNAVGAILTGMGADGARGMVAMRQAGARTIAQDEATSVVFGMPKEAYNQGGAERLVPLDRIGPAIGSLLSKKNEEQAETHAV